MLAWVLMRLCDLYSSSRSLSHRNQTIDLLCKSMDWFLYDSNLGHEKVNRSMMLYFLQSTSKETWNRRNAIYNICHKNSPLRLLFCVPNVVYPYDLKIVQLSCFPWVQSNVNLALSEKCPNTEFFLIRIFLHLERIRRDTEYLSLFSPNAGKHGPEKTPYLDTFLAVWK